MPKNARVSNEATRAARAEGLGPLPGPDREAEWIRAAREGDRDAFGRLVERHQDAVFTAAHYLVGDPEDAADVAQETFLRAWRSFSGFAAQSSLKTWLLVITTNVARSLASSRKAKKRSARLVRLEARPGQDPIDLPEPDGRGCPENRALRAEMKEALEAAIADLDEESRSLVVLRDLLGESYEKISDALGLPLGTVKSRIHRARLVLRESIERYLR